MPDITTKLPSPPQATSATGHPLPRRVSANKSLTLKYHRLAQEASLRASAVSTPAEKIPSSSRRKSSDDSHITGRSDPKEWFDQSNRNSTANFASNAMDADPPFFLRHSDSSSEEKPYNMPHQPIPPRPATRSSSGDDYRSVIDDLTVEIQELKQELRRYKQMGPDTLRKDQLFEIKIHGLPKRKRRELESTLRDFVSSVDGSPKPSSPRQKDPKPLHRDYLQAGFGSGSTPKHASSSSGSNARPTDSAYASMSVTRTNSTGTSLGHPSISSRTKSSESKVEKYLRNIPEGLYQRHMPITDKEKKKFVVRRLEQLFTGKIGGRHFHRSRPQPPPRIVDGQSTTAHLPSPVLPQIAPTMSSEAAREARMLPLSQQAKDDGGCHSHDAPPSNSYADHTISGHNGHNTSSGLKGSNGVNDSPPMLPPPEQRPTRPKDLDPYRTQVPSENMDYIKHLGLVPPDLLAGSNQVDVHPDADGWVYLNLLCNLAQLHMTNVTPDFVCSAVSGMSDKFQLSPDGRKIRWRGGTEGTRFNSDSSGNDSQRSRADTEDTEDSDVNKRRKNAHSVGNSLRSASSSRHASKFGYRVRTPPENFHYKPLFVHRESSEQSSFESTQSYFDPVDDIITGDVRWARSGSSTSHRRKRRHDGAIIYYSGAPFCTDLSCDSVLALPVSSLLPTNQAQDEPQHIKATPRHTPDPSLGYGLLSGGYHLCDRNQKMDIDDDYSSDLAADTSDGSSDFEFDSPWSTEPQYLDMHHLEPSGLGGILPEDHFMVVVTTKRPVKETAGSSTATDQKLTAEGTTDHIISRLASLSTSSLAPLTLLSRSNPPMVEIEYVSGRIKRLAPVSLPSPATYFPPFSTDSSSDDESSYGSEEPDEEKASEISPDELLRPKVRRYPSDDYPDGVELTSGDEDGEDPEDEPETSHMYDGDTQGSVATAGEIFSNINSGNYLSS